MFNFADKIYEQLRYAENKLQTVSETCFNDNVVLQFRPTTCMGALAVRIG